MRTSRSLAAAAASTLLAVGLVLGTGVSAQAAPIPTPTPVIPGAGGYVPTPVLPRIVFPSCATVVGPDAITATRMHTPGFGPLANIPGLYGAQATTLTNIIRAHPEALTCSFGVGGTRQVVVTETRITAAEYKVLKDWYNRNRVFATVGGGPVWSGSSTTLHYGVGTTGHLGSASEYATLSTAGVWITVRDVAAIGALPYFQMDATRQFYRLNPLVS